MKSASFFFLFKKRALHDFSLAASLLRAGDEQQSARLPQPGSLQRYQHGLGAVVVRVQQPGERVRERLRPEQERGGRVREGFQLFACIW